LLKGDVLGSAVVTCHVIEFQKRGLPHAHILVIMRADLRMRTREDINSIVCADIPNASTEPLLFDVIVRNMIYKACGALNTTTLCMREGKCCFNFPQEFLEETVLAPYQKPQYRHPDDGQYVLAPGSNYWYTSRNSASNFVRMSFCACILAHQFFPH